MFEKRKVFLLETLSKFIGWLFKRISHEAFREEDGEKVILWYELPFFAKFLGDGVLFLWDDRSLTPEARVNVIEYMEAICDDYRRLLLPKLNRKFTKPPPKLRCGIARGQITSIGNGSDFVGPCINMASRLQKLEEGQFSFAATRKGFTPKGRSFRLIKIRIRGMTNPELVYVLKREFKQLPKRSRKKLLR